MKEIIHGTEIHYELKGNGDSKVLLLHGWGCDMSLMAPVADALLPDYQVLLIDFPGHGNSGRPPETWGVPDFALCVEELLSKQNFSPCNVIAHSFGCRIATWLAAYRSSLFQKLIFTGGAGIRPKPSEESAKRTARYKKLKKYCDTIGRIPLIGAAGSIFEKKLRQKYGSRDYNALDDEMRKTFVQVINLDLSDLYEKFISSTLLIWGDSDTETPLWMGEEMEKRIPDAGLVVFEGGSHFAYLEQLPRFVTICRHFLKGVEA